MGNYKRYFTEAVANDYPTNAGFLITEIDKNFKHISADTNFAANSSNPIVMCKP